MIKLHPSFYIFCGCLFLGNPPPRLTWYKGHELIDDSYEQLNGRTTNILTLVEPVHKKDAGEIYTCQAVNNNQSIPVATKLKLEISCKFVLGLRNSRKY